MKSISSEPVTSTSYLRACYENLKKIDSSFSIVAISRKSGVSVSMLKMILTGRRRVTVKQLQLIQASMKLDIGELETLELLVASESGSRQARQRISERAGFTGANSQIRIRKMKRPLPMPEPWVTILLLMITEPNWNRMFDENPEKFIINFSKFSKIHKTEIASTIRFLIKNEFWKLEPDGNFIIDLSTPEGKLRREKNLNMQIQKSISYLAKFGDNSKAHFGGWLISASEKSVGNLKNEIANLIQKHIRNSEGDIPDRILSFSIQIFPTIESGSR